MPGITSTPLIDANLMDYSIGVRSFNWDDERRNLEGLPEGKGLNIAHEAVDRHATGDKKHQIALRWIRHDRTAKDFSYAELSVMTNRFANLLDAIGVKKGDTVFAFMGRIPELYVTALGTLKKTAIFCPLFSVFGPDPVFQRLAKGNAKVLVTTMDLFGRKIQPMLGHYHRLSLVYWSRRK